MRLTKKAFYTKPSCHRQVETTRPIYSEGNKKAISHSRGTLAARHNDAITWFYSNFILKPQPGTLVIFSDDILLHLNCRDVDKETYNDHFDYVAFTTRSLLKIGLLQLHLHTGPTVPFNNESL